MTNNLKILLGQLNFTIGDLDGNFNKIKEVLIQNHKHCDIAVFSELCMTGYPPLDLIYKKGFIENQNYYIEQLRTLSNNLNCGIVIGYIGNDTYSEPTDSNGKEFTNSLMFIHDGKMLGNYSKRLLPTYNIFDESRYFNPGNDNLILDFKGEKLAFLICEDSWYKESHHPLYKKDPIEELKELDFGVLITINASPSNTGKVKQRIKIIEDVQSRLGRFVPIVYVNQVGGNDDVIFDGGSFVYEYGIMHGSLCPFFRERTTIYDCSKEEKKYNVIGNLQLSDAVLFYHHIKLGIKDYVDKCGFKKVVIGSSGGIDSAVVMAMAVEALGADNVKAITMPTKFSSKGSVGDSVTLCENMGIELFVRHIQEDFELTCKEFGVSFLKEPSKLTMENMQARIRGRILMEYSNQFGNLVLSTGNKTEIGVGYFTLYGDSNGGIAPISDLYKMEVYALAKYINEKHDKEIIPLAIIEKEPSAELSEDQKDSDSLPPYPILDAIVRQEIEGDLLSDDQNKTDNELFNVGSEDYIKVHRLIKLAEFKRRQTPPTIRCHIRAWGTGRQYPVASRY